jgi:hypothetical protein
MDKGSMGGRAKVKAIDPLERSLPLQSYVQSTVAMFIIVMFVSCAFALQTFRSKQQATTYYSSHIDILASRVSIWLAGII